MPVTELSQHPITNLGPLPTSFTAPSACATRSPDLFLALKSVYPDRVQPDNAKKCEKSPLSDCFPSGSALDAAYTSAASLGFPSARAIAYFSPASACPDSYATAGLAFKNGDGDVSSAGVFVPPVVIDPPRRSPSRRGPSGRHNQEQPDFQCSRRGSRKRNYTVGYLGGCFSEVPESVYGAKEVCETQLGKGAYTWADATITYNDTIITGSLSYTATSVALTTQISTLTGEEAERFTPVASRPAITLIFNSAGPTSTGADGSDSGTGTGAAAPTETSPSAAHGSRMTTSRGGVGVLMTVWAVAALAGIALAVPF